MKTEKQKVKVLLLWFSVTPYTGTQNRSDKNASLTSSNQPIIGVVIHLVQTYIPRLFAQAQSFLAILMA
jgi:hypothetical protein